MLHCVSLEWSDHWSRVGVFLPAAAPNDAGQGEPETSDAILTNGRLAVASVPETRKAELMLREIDGGGVQYGDEQ